MSVGADLTFQLVELRPGETPDAAAQPETQLPRIVVARKPALKADQD